MGTGPDTPEVPCTRVFNLPAFPAVQSTLEDGRAIPWDDRGAGHDPPETAQTAGCLSQIGHSLGGGRRFRSGNL
ncbi:hypothetical protein HMPREF2549_00830 [Staphylococcus sp. HMSC074D07]|nr:hypothetical protein HMPREF9982_11867 [Staphylococcus epidermidis NIHLM021]OHQ79642.1 hypothetical protein HMPREF2549_00830 [Staphylococcus sp. HMSC074D07]